MQKSSSHLEGSCAGRDWIRAGPSAEGVERIEAHFCGHGYDPHRHDTYALGFTLEGVQEFRYRGGARRCLPGQLFVLHPDEQHDGHAGTESGLRYRSIYIDPSRIQAALEDSHALPFVRDPVSTDRRLRAALTRALADPATPWEELERDEVVLEIAHALAALDRTWVQRPLSPLYARAAAIAREYLEANLERQVASSELEAETGLGRYALARHFRTLFGTSPYRYLIMRRLDQVRRRLHSGASIAETALECGFADQSHMTRHFKKAYGLAPGRWMNLSRSAAIERDR